MTKIEIEARDGKEAKKIKDRLVGVMGCSVEDLSASIDLTKPIRMRFLCGEEAIDDVLDNIKEPNKLVKIIPDELSTHQGAKWKLQKRRKFV